MDEFKFVVKCFLFACLLMNLSQVQTNGITIESKVEVFLTESKAGQFIQEAAVGGVKVLNEAFAFTKAFIAEKINRTSLEKSLPVEDDI